MKRYPIHQSQLYKVSSPQELARRLGVELGELEEIHRMGGNYKKFKVGSNKKRDIQEPKDRLKRIHVKISSWLSRIETPEYLHSSVRGRSYITNARSHSVDENLLKVDIRSFFQNVTTHAVYLFFFKTMKCRQDVAMFLAKMLTVDGHLPTGSSVSPILSYFSHKGMFDEIEKLCDEMDLCFTVYVDDMCISGNRAVRETLFRVRGIIARSGLQSHKCRFFPAGVPWVITGTALTRKGLRLPHKRHLRIKEAFDALKELPEGASRDASVYALRSRLFEAAQLEPIWAERARTLSSTRSP